jgi:hypothetical protein
MTASHRWETTSSHVTSDGWVRYQRCVCGLTRVLLNAEPVGVARNDVMRSRVVDGHDHAG